MLYCSLHHLLINCFSGQFGEILTKVCKICTSAARAILSKLRSIFARIWPEKQLISRLVPGFRQIKTITKVASHRWWASTGMCLLRPHWYPLNVYSLQCAQINRLWVWKAYGYLFSYLFPLFLVESLCQTKQSRSSGAIKLFILLFERVVQYSKGGVVKQWYHGTALLTHSIQSKHLSNVGVAHTSRHSQSLLV